MSFTKDPEWSDSWLFRYQPMQEKERTGKEETVKQFIALFEHGGFATIWPLTSDNRLSNPEMPMMNLEQCYTPDDLMHELNLAKEDTYCEPLGMCHDIAHAEALARSERISKKRSDYDAAPSAYGGRRKEETFDTVAEAQLNHINVFSFDQTRFKKTYQ